jgi:Flp pilus assembly pilin Flp
MLAVLATRWSPGLGILDRRLKAGARPSRWHATGGAAVSARRTTISEETGATMVEYGFVVLFILLAALAAVRLFGFDVLGLFEVAADSFP